MRYIELFESKTDILTYMELLTIYPQIKSDLVSIGEWQRANPVDLTYKLVIEPISLVIDDASSMYASYDEFPEDEDRTNKIVELLESGSIQLPVFIEMDDAHNFVMEGRHRMVAFYLLNMSTLPVVYVSKL